MDTVLRARLRSLALTVWKLGRPCRRPYRIALAFNSSIPRIRRSSGDSRNILLAKAPFWTAAQIGQVMRTAPARTDDPRWRSYDNAVLGGQRLSMLAAQGRNAYMGILDHITAGLPLSGVLFSPEPLGLPPQRDLSAAQDSGLFRDPWIPPASFCCCPVDLRLKGGDTHDGFKWHWGFTAEDNAEPPPAGCHGASFEVTPVMGYRPATQFKGCRLEWWEWGSIPMGGGRDGNGPRLNIPPGSWNDRLEWTPGSATFRQWHEGPDNSDDASHEARARDIAQSADGIDDEAILRDAPCLTADNVGRGRCGEVEGEIILRSGCPGCRDIKAHWALRVCFDSNGDLERNWFMATNIFYVAPQPGDIEAPSPRDAVPEDQRAAYDEWAAPYRSRWTSVSGPRGAGTPLHWGPRVHPRR